jgi:hypothetical protein
VGRHRPEMSADLLAEEAEPDLEWRLSGPVFGASVMGLSTDYAVSVSSPLSI